eukprot:gnl/MRDRNA2_/MRDRNA2_102694_c0_seq1.p1 gnl/MRDRNA2_/MRDRNA2_102694_c0~~gnl/MRDRNA2_/MRDRNA2_102694_c0_seq1.p1  ORF type:complete len:900 (+),score=191.57 gnl/MRDRNA2_/MRDRNA2_102694_c0_seq1:145-2700(+)
MSAMAVGAEVTIGTVLQGNDVVFQGSMAIGTSPAMTTVSGQLAMAGYVILDFGIPLHFGLKNLIAGMELGYVSGNLLPQINSFVAGGELCVGSKSQCTAIMSEEGGDVNKVFSASLYIGMDLEVQQYYFMAKMSPITMEKMINVMATCVPPLEKLNNIIPPPIKQTGIAGFRDCSDAQDNDCWIIVRANPGIEDKVIDIAGSASVEIPAGYMISGSIKIFGVSVRLKLVMTVTKLDFYMELSVISILGGMMQIKGNQAGAGINIVGKAKYHPTNPPEWSCVFSGYLKLGSFMESAVSVEWGPTNLAVSAPNFQLFNVLQGTGYFAYDYLAGKVETRVGLRADALAPFIEEAVERLEDLLDGAKRIMKDAQSTVQSAKDAVTDVFKRAKEALNEAKNAVNSASDKIEEAEGKVNDAKGKCKKYAKFLGGLCDVMNVAKETLKATRKTVEGVTNGALKGLEAAVKALENLWFTISEAAKWIVDKVAQGVKKATEALEFLSKYKLLAMGFKTQLQLGQELEASMTIKIVLSTNGQSNSALISKAYRQFLPQGSPLTLIQDPDEHDYEGGDDSLALFQTGLYARRFIATPSSAHPNYTVVAHGAPLPSKSQMPTTAAEPAMNETSQMQTSRRGTDCITVTVGPSSGLGHIKTITHDGASGYQCPSIVDTTNWMSGWWDGSGDTFSISQNGDQVTATRTDKTKDWGLDLRFQCCDSIQLSHGMKQISLHLNLKADPKEMARQLFEKIFEEAKKFYNDVKEKFQKAVTARYDLCMGYLNEAKSFSIDQLKKEVLNKVNDVKNKAGNAINKAKDVLGKAFSDFDKQLANAAKEAAKAIGKGAKKTAKKVGRAFRSLRR